MSKDDSVTIAKGIGIILMVLGHSGIPMGKDFIYMFHMPLFFILAGYCFKIKHLSNFGLFIHRRINGLYIPFVKYGLLFLLLHNLFYQLNIYNGLYGYNGNTSYIYDIKEMAFHAILNILFIESEGLLGGYWFLPQLFIASILGWIVIKLFQKRKIVGLLSIFFLSVVFNWYGLYVPYTPISWLSIFATAFFFMGYILKEYYISLQNKSVFYWGGALLMLIIVLPGSFFWPTGMTRCTPFEQIPYFFSGIAGSLTVIIFSSWMIRFKNIMSTALIFIGNRTLEILTWHFLSFKIVSLIVIRFEHLTIEKLAMFPTIKGSESYWLIYTIVGLTVPCMLVYLNYYLKRLLINRNTYNRILSKWVLRGK